MTRIIDLLIRHGTPLVAFSVFIEQIGAPVPAFPTLILAGALSRGGHLSWTAVLIAGVVASIAADILWFALGRRYGSKILRLLCRISLSPDSCVRETEAKFDRWGTKSLLFAKFFPGFATIAPPLAGASNRRFVEFLILDTIGSFLWVATGVALGWTFHNAIGRLLESLERLGWWALVLIVACFVLFALAKWAQRRRFLLALRAARVSPHALKGMIDRGENPVIVDVRTMSSRSRDPRSIPGARVIEGNDFAAALSAVPRDAEIVLYCT